MARFDEYAQAYQSIRMERRDGILQLTFHTNGGPLQWGELPHLPHSCFPAISWRSTSVAATSSAQWRPTALITTP